MSQVDNLFNQFKAWLDGDALFDDLDQVVQKTIDALVEEEEEADEPFEKADPTSSDVHVDGVNWKTPQRKKKKALEMGSDLIHKANEEQRFTLGPWYIPNKGDAHDEWTDAEELQKALWDYVRSGDRDIRLQHNKDIVAGEWVEAMSFPVPVTLNMTKATGDAKEVTYPSGTVFLGVKWNEWAWDLVKANKITGFSIGGSAARVEMGIPASDNNMFKHSRQVANRYVSVVKNSPALTVEEQLADRIRKHINGEPLEQPVDAMHPKIIIDGVKYDIVPLSKSYNGKVFNVAGLYGEDGSIAVVRTDGERFWASGSSKLQNLPFEKAQIVFAEVAKAKTFGGDRSAAGQYAAEVRWGNRAREKGIAAAGTGPFAPPSTPEGEAMRNYYGSMETHVDFDALAAEMVTLGMEPLAPKTPEPEYATLRKHMSPERIALHDRIIAEHFKNEDGSEKTPPAGQPEYVFMGGGPAAGKSSMLKEGHGPEWAGNGTNKSEKNSDGSVKSQGTDKHSVAVNCDEIKGQLPPYEQLVGNRDSKSGVGVAGRSGQTRAASLVHEESSILSKEVDRQAQSKGLNVILDGTGDNNPKTMAGKVEKVRNAKGSDGKPHNYRVTGIYATVPTEMAVERAKNRGLPIGKKYTSSDGYKGVGQGRYVDPSVVRGTHAGVSKVFPEVATSFDSVKLFDTSSRTPRLLAETTRGKAVTVVDQAGYTEFLGKGQ